MKVLNRNKLFDQYKECLVEDTWTFQEMLDYLAYPKEIQKYVEIRVNGQLVNPKFWAYARPNNNTNVAIALMPAGGASGNDIFRTAFTIGAIALGGAAGAALFPTAGLSGASLFKAKLYQGLTTAAFTLVGGALANSMFPPSIPGIADTSRENLPSVTGQSNQIAPNDVVIRNYGRNRVFPRVVAQPYTYYVGRDQYIVSLYDFGSGTQEVDLGTLRIGNTPITKFKDVDYRLATAGNFQIYKNKVNSTNVQFLFEDVGTSVTRTTAENTEAIELSFTWPQGLIGFLGRKQKAYALLQDIIIEIREVGSGSFVNINQYDVELDPGLRTNKSFIQILSLPTTSTLISSESVSTPSIFPGGAGSNYTVNTFECNYADGDLLFHRPVEKADNLSVPDDTVSRFLIAGDRIKIGDQSYIVVAADVATKTVNSKEYRAARLNKILGFRSRYNSRETSLITSSGREETGNIFLPTLLGNNLNPSITVTDRTTAGFRYELKVNPNLGPKQWDVRVTYAALDIEGGFTLASSRTNLIKNFQWDQIKGYEKVNPVRTLVPHQYLELKAKASEEISGQVETLSAEVESFLPVYDNINNIWKTEKSSNPAWVFASILTNEANQRAVSLDQLDEVSLKAWADYCDSETITYQGNTVGFECNFVHDFPITVKGLLEQVCSSGRATLNIVNGKYGVVIDENRTIPTQMFNQRNIVDMNVTRSYAPTPDGIRVKFVDPNSNWQENTVIAYADGQDSTTAEIIEDLEGFGITSLAQAWRQGRYFLAQQELRRDNIQLEVDFEALACSRGDLVYFSHDVKKEGGVPARIKSIVGNIVTIDEVAVDQGGTQILTVRKRIDGAVTDYNIVSFPGENEIELDNVLNISVDDLCVYGVQDQVVKSYIVKAIRYASDLKAEVDLIEYNAAIYDADNATIPDYEVITSDNPFGKYDAPTAVQNLSGTYKIDVNQGEKRYIYNVDLDWDEPLKGSVKNYEIYLIANNKTELVGFSDSSEFNYEISGSLIGQLHRFKVVAVNPLGQKISLAEAPSFDLVPNDDETAPENVENFNANVLTDTIELDWSFTDDLDIDKYAIRFSTNTDSASWEQSTPITAAGPTQSSATVPLRTGTYLIRAIDYAGNKSPQASKVVTTVPEISKIEFISNVSAPAWNGVSEDVQFLGDSLILKSVDDLNTFVSDIGEFFFQEVFDLGDIFTARFIADVSASGFSRSGLMANWTTLAAIDPIAGTFNDDDFDASAYIRTRNQPDTMVSWTPLSSVDYLSFGSELTATPWVKFKAGDFTGRIFQLKVRLESENLTVTPIVYSVGIEANWNERIVNEKDQLSGTPVVFDGAFVERPAIEITAIQNFQNGDYYNFISLDETGFLVQFYDTNDVPVNDRTFDYIAKGIGKKYTLEDINF